MTEKKASSESSPLLPSTGMMRVVPFAAQFRRIFNNCLCSKKNIFTNRSTSTHQQQQQQRPHRIILCRHGLSLGNVDATVYVDMADWKIPLDEKGKEQAKDAGRRLSNILDGEKCFIYHSPYRRTTETMDLMVSQLLSTTQILGTRSEPRIAEQQFGNFQNYEEVKSSRDERVKFGRFFYRFPSGEAGLDVYTRVTSFISTLYRDVTQMRDVDGVDMQRCNVLIVTHGLTLRLFLMRWFQIDVEEFETMYNPDNAFLAVMERQTCPKTGKEWYQLTKESADHLQIKTRSTKPIVVPTN